MAALDEHARADRRPRVPLGSAPDRKRQPPAGAKHATRLRECGPDIGHQHLTALAEHSVDRLVVEVDLLGIRHAELDVLDSELRPVAAGDVDHIR